MVSRFISKYPIVKTMGAYFCINVAADFNEQVFIKGRSKETYDRGKTARIAATCTFVTSPMLFAWIKFIDRAIPGKVLLSVVKKVLADAFMFAPCVISTFYITTNILEGKEDLTAEWKQKFYPTWTTGLCYWPFVQTVNFALIPMKYKTCLYMPTASFIWMNYLCYMKDKKVVNDNEEKDQHHLQASIPVTQKESSSFIVGVPRETKTPLPQNCVLNIDSNSHVQNVDSNSHVHHNQCSVIPVQDLSKSQPSEHCVQSDIGLCDKSQSAILFHTDIFMHGLFLSPN